MIFGVLDPEKFDINSLHICPPHLYIVATLPWEIQKSHFNSIIHIYFRLFTLSQKNNKLLLPYPPHLKNVIALPCKLHKFFTFSFFRAYRVPIHDTDELRASCCDMG